MLRIDKLVLENFGPYYGTNEFNFPQGDGVTIVWGHNGFGKTTIMNGFRYVLWGKLLNRKRRDLQPHTYVNSDAVIEGKNMKVELYMVYKGENFIVSRGLKRVSGDGTHQGDYLSFTHVYKSSEILTKEDSEDLLFSALPDKISRFYLFDGELLSEYEDLLDEQDDSGVKIKKSIEDILGLPILENARDIISAIQDGFNQDATNAGKKSERTKQISTDLESNREAKQTLEGNKNNTLSLLEEEKNNKLVIEDLLNSNSRYRGIIVEKREKEKLLNSSLDKLESKRSEVSELLDSSWKNALSSLSESLIENINKVLEPIENQKNISERMMAFSQMLKESLQENQSICPVCETQISEDVYNKIMRKITSSNANYLSEADKSTFEKLVQDRKFLKSCLYPNNKEIIRLKIEDINEISTENDILKTQISNLSKELSTVSSSISEDEAESLPEKLSKCVKKIGEYEDAIRQIDDSISTTETAIAKLTKVLSKSATDADVAEAIKKQDFSKSVLAIFEDGIAAFRNKLKDNVEKDASEFFKKISHQEEYDHLSINDNYGLEIVKQDGSVIPNRSSGYEQVVAISLISALHKNAPIEGPIFMDSTFQRVDEIHKENILKSLPYLGRQIIVLAYPTEISKEKAKNSLGENLLKEFHLNQITSSKTQIL